MQRCTCDLKDKEELKNDHRFVKMWIEYVSHTDIRERKGERLRHSLFYPKFSTLNAYQCIYNFIVRLFTPSFRSFFLFTSLLLPHLRLLLSDSS